MRIEFEILYTDQFITIYELDIATGERKRICEQIKRPQPRSPERIIKEFVARERIYLWYTTGLSSMKPAGFVASTERQAIII